MLITSTRSLAVSLALHGALLAFGYRGAIKPPSINPSGGVMPLEGSITVDGVPAVEVGAPAWLPSTATVRAPVDSVPALPTVRAQLARAASTPAPTVARSAASPALSVASSRDANPAPHGTAAGRDSARPHAFAGSSDVPLRAGATATSGSAPLKGAEWASAGSAARGTGQPSSTGNQTAPSQLAGYLRGVRERVTRHREYPYLARRAGLEGTVCLRISITASGNVLDVTPTCGTSNGPLLQAALKSVARASPFPPLPPALGQRLIVDVPVVFELDEL